MIDVASVHAAARSWEPVVPVSLAPPAPKPDAAVAAAESLDQFAIKNLGGKGEEIFQILSKEGDLDFKETMMVTMLSEERLFYVTLMQNLSTTLRDGISKLTQG